MTLPISDSDKASSSQPEGGSSVQTSTPAQLTFQPWLVRIPEVFDGFAPEIIKALGGTSSTRFGSEYHLVKMPVSSNAMSVASSLRSSEAAPFVQWNLPVHHSWPCNPQKMEGFIEKAAQVLLKKFGEEKPQAILMGQLHPSSPNSYYKSLASNLRGRTLQLFPKMAAASAEEQDSRAKTLFCLVGKEGLFCGMQSPLECNGLYAGGTKFISQESPETISRAGAKVAEALHYLQMYRPALPAGSHWVELGASPGGMTSELLARGQKVTAVDRASLDPRLNNQPQLTFVRSDVATFKPKTGTVFDVILSDLNGDANESFAHVIRLAGYLRRSGMVIFTLKAAGAETVQETLALCRNVEATAAKAGLTLFAKTHLTYNRKEFTFFFEKE